MQFTFYIGISFMSNKKKEAISEGIAYILQCFVNRWQRWAVAGLDYKVLLLSSMDKP
jgi:hypothetical protein